MSIAVSDSRRRLCVAVDVSSLDEAERLLQPLRGRVGWAKVGKQLFTAEGPESVRRLRALGFAIFLDLKFHDIPNTVAAAAVEAVRLGVDLFNVHAAGGPTMMRETVRGVRREAAERSTTPPRIIAVTLLTSLDRDQLVEIGLTGDPESWVRRWTRMSLENGLDGVVCSAREVAMLRQAFGARPFLVTPGIRPAGAGGDDQRRTMTPGAAAKAGADLLVVGRPLTKAPNPSDAATAMLDEIASSLA